MSRFGQDVLGKGIVHGKDTPNFVANRIGVFAMMHLIKLAIDGGYTVEEVDAIFGAPLGRPKSAVFRTADVVGLDTIIHVANNCYESLTSDERREDFKVPALLEQMAEKKMLGDKTGGGFMKKTPEGIVTLDFKTMQYRPQQKAKFASVGATKGVGDVGERIRKVLAGDDKAADLARRVTYATLAYSSNRIGEIADDYVNIDRGMRWGFGWDVGPFETWDAIGVQKGVDEMAQARHHARRRGSARCSSRAAPASTATAPTGTCSRSRPSRSPTSPRELPAAGVPQEGRRRLRERRRHALRHRRSHRLPRAAHEDERHRLSTSSTPSRRASTSPRSSSTALVVGNHDPQAFSAGANIFMMLMAANQGNWKAIGDMGNELQQSLMRLRYASVPTVTAPFGLTLGGGAEIAMHGAASRASAELYMGLVEAGVGLLPAGGGCKELLARHLEFYPDDADPFVMVKKVFLQIGLGKVSMSAEEARAMGMLSPTDGVSLNRDFLIADAKQTALGLARAGYRPPRQRTMRLPGASGYATIRSMLQMMHEAHQISAHDVVVGSKIGVRAHRRHRRSPLGARHTSSTSSTSSARPSSRSCGEEKTRERMQYMLMNNKPLRN